VKDRYKRVTDLFVEGTEVVLDDSPEDPLIIWVQKPNPFEREEARRDAQVAGARFTLTLQDDSSDEIAVFRAGLVRLDRQDLVDAIVDLKFSEDLVLAQNELRDDKDWTEKLAIVDRSGGQLEGRGQDDPEVLKVAEINREYLTETNDRVDARRAARRDELERFTELELRDEYERAYIEALATANSLREFRTTEIFFAARVCSAVPNDDATAGWDHSGCAGHRARIFDDRQEVREIDDELHQRISAAISRVTMSPREAKNSARRGSSSESSPPPSEPGESTASTPEETSNEPAGTSAPPSAIAS